MGTVDDFIEKVKQNEGFRFDKQVADLIGIDKASLANAKVRNKLPNSYVMWYCENYNITLKEFHKDITTTINKQKDNDMYEFALELAKEKIASLEEKIQVLEKTKVENNSSNHTFENMDYDIMTYQTYDIDCDKPYKWFSSYEIVRWRDFCKKLGYVGQEASELHDFIQAYSTNAKDYKGKKYKIFEESKDKSALYDYVYTQQFFKNAKLKNFINAVESYNITYLHKDGSLVPAILFVLYDVKGDSSVTKIKFLDKDN